MGLLSDQAASGGKTSPLQPRQHGDGHPVDFPARCGFHSRGRLRRKRAKRADIRHPRLLICQSLAPGCAYSVTRKKVQRNQFGVSPSPARFADANRFMPPHQFRPRNVGLVAKDDDAGVQKGNATTSAASRCYVVKLEDCLQASLAGRTDYLGTRSTRMTSGDRKSSTAAHDRLVMCGSWPEHRRMSLSLKDTVAPLTSDSGRAKNVERNDQRAQALESYRGDPQFIISNPRIGEKERHTVVAMTYRRLTKKKIRTSYERAARTLKARSLETTSRREVGPCRRKKPAGRRWVKKLRFRLVNL